MLNFDQAKSSAFSNRRINDSGDANSLLNLRQAAKTGFQNKARFYSGIPGASSERLHGKRGTVIGDLIIHSKIQIAELKYTLSEIAFRKASLDYPSQAALPDLSEQT
jgi:hypothetical protein